MSANDVAAFLRERAEASNMTYTDISRRANISRQTWYKLINAQVAEAKLSTVARVCDVLHIDPREIMAIYFNQDETHSPQTTSAAITTPTSPSTPTPSSLPIPNRERRITQQNQHGHLHP